MLDAARQHAERKHKGDEEEAAKMNIAGQRGDDQQLLRKIVTYIHISLPI
jgi:hypothetical protein